MGIHAVAFHQSRHLEEGQLHPAHDRCPFCGSGERAAVGFLQRDPDVALLKCARCRAASASRNPTAAVLDDYYGSYYETPQAAGADGHVTFENVRRFGGHLARRVERHLARAPLRILDFGGGDGSIAVCLAELLVARGFPAAEVTVVDYNKSTVAPGDRRVTVAHCDDLPGGEAEGRFDFLIASAIVEHLPQPRDAVFSLLNLVRPGGMLYARTPYNLQLMRLFRLFGIQWDFTFPAHIHDLGQDFWETFFSRIVPAGSFTILESKPSIVESSLRTHLLGAAAAYALKAPWYLLGRRWGLVGGWEIFVRRDAPARIEPQSRSHP